MRIIHPNMEQYNMKIQKNCGVKKLMPLLIEILCG